MLHKMQAKRCCIKGKAGQEEESSTTELQRASESAKLLLSCGAEVHVQCIWLRGAGHRYRALFAWRQHGFPSAGSTACLCRDGIRQDSAYGWLLWTLHMQIKEYWLGRTLLTFNRSLVLDLAQATKNVLAIYKSIKSDESPPGRLAGEKEIPLA
jgi:hypothetical protein